MRLFVSYSRRDGMVSSQMLQALEAHLQGICDPFIHCLHDTGSRWEQLRVVRALIASHAVLLVESPATAWSPWVRFELLLARMLGLPLLRLDAGVIQGLMRP